MATVDVKTAALILERALIEAQLIADSKAQKIDAILCGTHKTYRYILVTAVLGKATNEKIGILSLQADNGANGKYDARSLCHHVIVPFETVKLPGCLGSFNEPQGNQC